LHLLFFLWQHELHLGDDLILPPAIGLVVGLRVGVEVGLLVGVEVGLWLA
jgi:hypothetical protein